MAYDPNFPPAQQPLNAAPFRDQFNALNDAKAPRPVSVDPLLVPISDPPQQAEVMAILAKLNEHIIATKG